MEFKDISKIIRVKIASTARGGGSFREIELFRFTPNIHTAVDEKGVELVEQPEPVSGEVFNRLYKEHKEEEKQKKIIEKSEARKALQMKKEAEEQAEAQRVLDAAEALLKKREKESVSEASEQVGESKALGVDSLI